LAFIISALFSSDAPLHSLEYIWFNYGWIFCMYFMIYMFKPEDIFKFLKIMAWTAVAAGAYTVVQGFTGWPLLGGLAAIIDKGVLAGISMGKDALDKAPVGFRAAGVFSHHLTAGGQMAMLSIISYGIIKKKWLLVFIPAGLFFSFAYSAWGGFILGIVFVLIIKYKKVKWGLALAVLFGAVFISVPGNVSVLEEKLSGRLAIWEASWHMYKTSPVLGIGAGRYTPTFKEDNYRQKFPHLPSSGASGHPHNLYLSKLVRGGAVTFLAFLFFIVKFVQLYIRPPTEMKNTKWFNLYYLLWGALVCIFGAGFFQNYLTAAQNSVLIWTVIGIIVSLKVSYSEKLNFTDQ
ncbi:MAG: O-antigen ligase family protein, partial [Elusimicrobiota bacterium]